MIDEKVIGPDQEAAFEAGIKLGALYHQFIGAPVDMDSASSLEKAMTEAVRVQPHVKDAIVEIDREMLSSSLSGFGYTSLNERMLAAEVTVLVDHIEVTAKLDWIKGMEYPLMRIISSKSV